MGPLAKAGAVGDGLLACRRYALVEGLCCHVKEQHEEVSRLCSIIRDDKKEIEWIFLET